MYFNYRKAIAIIAIALFTGNASSAQAPGGAAPEQIKKLYFFNGDWQGKAKMTMNGQTSEFSYTMSMKKDADGWGLQYHEHGAMKGAPAYNGFGALTYDLGEDMIHIFTCSNYGDVHDHKGKWNGDKSFTLKYNGTMEGKPMEETLSCTILDANSWRVDDRVSVGGQTTQEMEIVLHKRK